MVVLVRVLVSNGSGGSCGGDTIFVIGGRVNTDISGKSSVTSGDWAVVVVLVEVLAVSFSARFSARMYWCTKS